MLEKIISGHTELVSEFLAAGNPATITDDGGVALIKWCAYHGDVNAIQILLEHGEVLDCLGENLDLNGAVFHGYPELCDYLIENGADVNFPHQGTDEAPLHSAFCKNSTPEFERIVEILLTHGADPNAITKPGIETGSFMRDCRTRAETPLHRAAAFGSEKCIDMLLAAGASKEIKDVNGDSPLSWASWHLRPRAFLRKLCYSPYKIRPTNNG